jgi:hypothetical protein
LGAGAFKGKQSVKQKNQRRAVMLGRYDPDKEPKDCGRQTELEAQVTRPKASETGESANQGL